MLVFGAAEPMKTSIVPLPNLSARSKRILEDEHRRAITVSHDEGLPWADPEFARRFTVLTDVRRRYWGPPDADARRVRALLAARFEKRPRVVDLCCGAGRHALALAASGVRVTALDVSTYAIRRARGLLSRKPEAVRARLRFVVADVLEPPPTGPSEAILLLGEQATYFLADSLRRLFAVWRGRLTHGGRFVVELPRELPTYTDELFFLPEPLFLDRPCWVRYTRDPNPLGRTVTETFTCFAPGARRPRPFAGTRRFYRPEELAALSGASGFEVLGLPLEPPRTARDWVVLRWS